MADVLQPMTFVAGGKPKAKQEPDLSASFVEGGKPKAKQEPDLSASFVAGGKPTIVPPEPDLSMPLSTPIAPSIVRRINWAGLNRRHTLDSGVMSKQCGISTEYAPYLSPAPTYSGVAYCNDVPLGLFGVGEYLMLLYRVGAGVFLVCYRSDLATCSGNWGRDGTLVPELNTPRCIVKFNHYSDPKDPASGEFTEHFLVFPDMKTFSLDNDSFGGSGQDTRVPLDIGDLPTTGQGACPKIKLACVYNSRLFGIDDDRIYASGFNDYSNWKMDDAGEYNANNAWCSPTGANTSAGSKLCAITNYQNHVVCFRNDFIHELYNNKNPFRIQDIFSDGTIDRRSVCEVAGKLFFVDSDDVKIYTGGNPIRIGAPLGIDKFKYAVAGSDGRNYHLYCNGNVGGEFHYFVYDTVHGLWSERRGFESQVLNFAKTNFGFYALCADGELFNVEGGGHNYEWSCETDLSMYQDMGTKHINRIHVLADIPINAWLYIDIIGSDGTAQNVYASTDQQAGRECVPIRVVLRKSADFGFKVRFRGAGKVIIRFMELYISQGGDILRMENNV